MMAPDGGARLMHVSDKAILHDAYLTLPRKIWSKATFINLAKQSELDSNYNKLLTVVHTTGDKTADAERTGTALPSWGVPGLPPAYFHSKLMTESSFPQNRWNSVVGSVIDEELHNGRTWARRVRDPWDPCILALDGGGIKGYSSLLILKQLMQEVWLWEQKLDEEEHVENREVAEEDMLPCHYFDYMYGTSTGGLIATMLGRLRMSVSQCLEIYCDVGDKLFGKRRTIVPLVTKYNHEPLEQAVRDIVRRYCKQHCGSCDGNDYHPWGLEVGNEYPFYGAYNEGNICQSICLTATRNGKVDEAYLLRTYTHRYNDNSPDWITRYNAGSSPLRIWQVTRATSAAPFYFKMLEADIGGEIKTFKDGGIRENNPAGAAWNEFLGLHGEEAEPALLLSIGTGRPNEAEDGFASTWPGPLGHVKVVKSIAEKLAIFKNVLIKYTEGEKQHKSMLSTAKGEYRWYKRLNSTGLERMKLDEWIKGPWTDANGQTTTVSGGASLTKMENATAEYLSRDYDKRYDTYAPPSVMVTQCAEILVRHRRAREAGARDQPERWDMYSGKFLSMNGGPARTLDLPIDNSHAFSVKP